VSVVMVVVFVPGLKLVLVLRTMFMPVFVIMVVVLVPSLKLPSLVAMFVLVAVLVLVFMLVLMPVTELYNVVSPSASGYEVRGFGAFRLEIDGGGHRQGGEGDDKSSGEDETHDVGTRL